MSMAFTTRLARLRLDHLVYCVPGTLDDAIDRFAKKTGVRPALGGQHNGLGTHNALVALGNGAYFEILARDPAQPTPARTWMGIEQLCDKPMMTAWAVAPAGVDRSLPPKKRAPPTTPSSPSKMQSFLNELRTEVKTGRGDKPLDRAALRTALDADVAAAGTAAMEATVASACAAGYDPGKPLPFSRLKPDGSTLSWTLAYNHFTAPLPGDGLVPFLIDWHSPTPADTAPSGFELVGLRAEHPDPKSVAPMLLAIGIEPEDLQLVEGPRSRLVATLKTPKGTFDF